MLNFHGPSRRDVLSVGTLAFAGLSLADVLRLRAAGPPTTRAKSVILIWLRGGASHLDTYDMKPDAPAEIRGEFKPIRTNVPRIQLCEHLPLHAKIMDKLAILRGVRSVDVADHTPHYHITGFPDRGKRPAVRQRRQPAPARRRDAAVRQPDVQGPRAVRQ
ncbi:MAG: DUF1501 domain-containing protein [Gemmataceae bacterium]